ncbi:MAG TPA: hypothetical protein PL169_18855, partial [Leptospiraceae bacterium]|nr:hypothetical protein [Leptospiraceae bacterium]
FLMLFCAHCSKTIAEKTGKCDKETKRRKQCALLMYAGCIEQYKPFPGRPEDVCKESLPFIDAICDLRSEECRPSPPKKNK